MTIPKSQIRSLQTRNRKSKRRNHKRRNPKPTLNIILHNTPHNPKHHTRKTSEQSVNEYLELVGPIDDFNPPPHATPLDGIRFQLIPLPLGNGRQDDWKWGRMVGVKEEVQEKIRTNWRNRLSGHGKVFVFVFVGFGWDVIFGVYVDELAVVKCELQAEEVSISQVRGSVVQTH